MSEVLGPSADSHFAEEVVDGEVLVAMRDGRSVLRHEELAAAGLAVQHGGRGWLTWATQQLAVTLYFRVLRASTCSVAI